MQLINIKLVIHHVQLELIQMQLNALIVWLIAIIVKIQQIVIDVTMDIHGILHLYLVCFNNAMQDNILVSQHRLV